MRTILITGSNGFIGKNLQLRLAERKDVQFLCFTRDDNVARLPALLQGVDFVLHLAGVNRWCRCLRRCSRLCHRGAAVQHHRGRAGAPDSGFQGQPRTP